MQTRDYKDLFRLISSMIGTGGELSDGEQTQVADFINRRFQQAFDESPVWPRYLISSEKRGSASAKVEGHSESAANQIYTLVGNDALGGGVYIGATDNSYALARQSNTETTPQAWLLVYLSSGFEVTILDGVVTTNPTFADGGSLKAQETPTPPTPNLSPTPNPWDCNYTNDVIVNPVLNFVPFVQPGKTNVGEFLRIHKDNAFNKNSALEYDFYVNFEGANIINNSTSNENFVYVTYKEQFTPFDVSSSYYSSTAKVPAEFFNFISHAVYADFLRVQNRQQEAIAEEQIAQTYLNLELEKVDIKSNNNTVNKRFSTYVNRQAR